MSNNWREYLHELQSPFTLGDKGRRFIDVFLAASADTTTQGYLDATVIANLGKTDEGALDEALQNVADERGGLFKYSNETTDEWRARLIDAWHVWSLAGSPAGVSGQLRAAGFSGSMVQRDITTTWSSVDFGVGTIDTTDNYYSQFVVVIPVLSGTVGTAWTWGDGTVFNETPIKYWGPVSQLVPSDRLAEARNIIRKFRAVEFIPTGIVLLGPATAATFFSDPAYETDAEPLFGEGDVEFHRGM